MLMRGRDLQEGGLLFPMNDTLKTESSAGRNFRDFASFFGVRESLYP